MKKNYGINPKTNRLHIMGNCCHSRVVAKDWKYYETENQAAQDNGRVYIPCKLCYGKRDSQ